MNLPTSTILSSARLAGAAGLAAALLMGCGGSAPPREREEMRDADPAASQKQLGEKGTGGISFRYSNQSTDAKMDIDLGSTEVYLEMSGRSHVTRSA